MKGAIVKVEIGVQQQDTTYPRQVSLMGISLRAPGIGYSPYLLLALTTHPSGIECCRNPVVLSKCDEKVRGIEENGSRLCTIF